MLSDRRLKTDEADVPSILRQQLRGLQAVAKIVADEPDLSTLLVRLAQAIAEIVDADQTCIGIVNAGFLTVESIYTEGRQLPLDLTIHMRDSFLGKMLVHQTPYCTENIALEETDVRPLAEDRFPCAAVLAVPIVNHQNSPLGLVECRRTALGNPFSPTDVEMLQTIVTQMVSGIERGRMFEYLIRWNRSLESLFAFNAALNEQLDTIALVRHLVEHATSFLDAEAGLAGIIEEDGAIRTHDYWHDEEWHEIEIDWRQRETTAVFVANHQCPYLTNTYDEDVLAEPTFRDYFGVKNVLTVPFLDGDQNVLGFVEMHNKERGNAPFTWSDVSFLESLAYTMAVTLRNVRLVRELNQKRRELQALSVKHINLLEDERAKISRELHDEAGQALIGIKLNLQLLERRIPAELEDVREETRDLRDLVNQTTTRLRSIAHSLRQPALDELGLHAAVQQLINELNARSDLVIHFQTIGLDERMIPPAETACYRIIQEGLTNVMRYAQADQVLITMTGSEQYVILKIKDDGIGFDPSQASSGLGLLGIRERVAMLNGEMQIFSNPDEGTELFIRLWPEHVFAPPDEIKEDV